MKVGVIMGGISSEREISLKSGKSIIENIDKNKYEVIPVVIDEKVDIINKVKDLDFALLAFSASIIALYKWYIFTCSPILATNSTSLKGFLA